MPRALPAPPPDRMNLRPEDSCYTIDPLDHLAFARAIARGVRADYGLYSGSQEEADLEATAYLAVCNYAPRFDAERSYRAGAERSIVRSCRRWRRGRPTGPAPRSVPFAGAEQAHWARGLARAVAVRRRFGPRSIDRSALFALALSIAAARAAAFDPIKAFRGWASVEVRLRCTREALRLRNGGLYHTTSDPAAKRLRVTALPRVDVDPDEGA
jgi:hypothetical protein